MGTRYTYRIRREKSGAYVLRVNGLPIFAHATREVVQAKAVALGYAR